MIKPLTRRGRQMEPKEEILLITLEKIQKILPHEGDKLLLDEVIVDTEKGLIAGYLAVREEHCRNHNIGGKPVLRGVDLGEMAFQLLASGIIHLTEYSYLIGRTGMARGINMTFSRPSYPGAHIIMEIKITDILVKPGNAKKTNMIVGEKAIAKGTDGKIKAIITDIKLAILLPEITPVPTQVAEI